MMSVCLRLKLKTFFHLLCLVIQKTQKHFNLHQEQGINGNEQKMTVHNQASRCFNHEHVSLSPVPAPAVGHCYFPCLFEQHECQLPPVQKLEVGSEVAMYCFNLAVKVTLLLSCLLLFAASPGPCCSAGNKK